MFGKTGVTFDQPVELRDVLPTFLNAAGQPVPAHLDGMSVLDNMRGKAGGWRDVIDMEHDVCYDPSNHWNALTDGHCKYIYHAQKGEEQLFDLDEDPRELHDLASEPKNRGRVKEWRARMAEHLAERGEPFAVKGDLTLRPERMLYSPNPINSQN
jgi:arylsulfatase A-like enzyme